MRKHSDEPGIGLVSLLVVLAVMGILTAVALTETTANGGGPGNLTGPLSGSTVAGSTGAAAGDISAAGSIACRSDYEVVVEAASVFAVLHGHRPATMADLATLLEAPTTGSGFSIGLDSSGRVTVATPGHPATPGSGNCVTAGR